VQTQRTNNADDEGSGTADDDKPRLAVYGSSGAVTESPSITLKDIVSPAREYEKSIGDENGPPKDNKDSDSPLKAGS
jgi:hypothetical protein